jgi:hypothetical protein
MTPKETTSAILADSKNMSVNQLHAKYLVKKPTIRNILKRNGVKPLRSRKLIPKERLAEALKDGWLTCNELSIRCNSTNYIVMQSLRAYGIIQGRKPSVRHRLKDSSRAFKVLGYLMANPEESYDFIAKQFLCTREFVSHVAAMARQEGIIK